MDARKKKKKKNLSFGPKREKEETFSFYTGLEMKRREEIFLR